ncbi:GxxExxY protein [Herbivorax sp. ANBcel31]|uniref:AAA-like domain-containing protein n=1 Tax=Herbivorax sp. ANBcel31 TaxID=3069754 RepID=UPI0027B42ADC|nr:AAA-like domain-containing protein [Herbivorax sp. ANBcel31]MDQ2085598.1 GxxExxY protein [Herbivorax sp. ANBcel31]
MKEFNVTGVCVPRKYYMVDISKKLDQIIRLIEKEEYFTMNRARQYGKTTTLSNIYDRLKDRYLVIDISFEGIGDNAFANESAFVEVFTKLVTRRLRQNSVEQSIIKEWEEGKEDLDGFDELSWKITHLSQDCNRDIILLIDEVDKSSDNQLFLHFLGILRNKYLDREEGLDSTFKSVILAGVYDVKNLKIKIRPDSERKFNFSWNIAADFDVDMSFNPEEISSMLIEYEKDHDTGMDIEKISSEIYKYTKGYPFLVSKACKIIDEKLSKDWSFNGVNNAVKILLEEKNTLFDDLFKNLEHYKDLYNVVYNILVVGKRIQFNVDNPSIDIGVTFGILSKEGAFTTISNKIFELRIYNYLISKRSTQEGELLTYKYRTNFIENGNLNMEIVLNKFQEVMHDEFREKDVRFIEREGRLLFLCFLKPIINSVGFYYVEAETRMDNRMDVVITYNNKQYIVELKIWRGESYEQKAIEQLWGYLESKREDKGYLILFNFNENKQYKKEWKRYKSKDIYMTIV